MPDEPEFILIRHGEVQPQYKKICYGASDVPLSDEGRRRSLELAGHVAEHYPPVVVFHSDLQRTSILADAISTAAGDACCCIADIRLQERDYGAWQGMTWDEAYQSDPDNFHHLIEQPDTYCPPGGETTTAMQDRMFAWYDETRQRYAGRNVSIIAVSHSGPITALLGWLLGLHATRWQPWMPAYLQISRIHRGEVTQLNPP